MDVPDFSLFPFMLCKMLPKSRLPTISANFIIVLIAIYTPTQVLTTAAGKDEILDTSFPIIIGEVNNAESRNYSGNIIPLSKSFFGYTVSLAKGTNLLEDSKGWIFIGAPKSNTSSSNKYSNGDIEPGVIWRCSLGQLVAADECKMMDIDPHPGKGEERNKPGNPKHEDHNGAWIGVSSEINHDRFVTCGMRWSRGENNFYNGICYWFADNKQKSYRGTDINSLVDKKLYDQRLIPFFTREKDEERLFRFTNRYGGIEDGHEWQLSQAGLSVHLFKNMELGSQPNLLIGAPGVRQWAGAVVLYTNTNINGSVRLNRNPKDPNSTFSEFVVLNRGVIPTKKLQSQHLNWDEYFGYSVSSGRYLAKDKVLYASGAPRAENECGAVIIFDVPPPESSNATTKRQIKQIRNITAPGGPICFSSYFGSVIHSVDLEGNGLDALIVGAPMYTFSTRWQTTANTLIETIQLQAKKSNTLLEKKAKVPTNSLEMGDHGCVFIYKFGNDGTIENTKTIYHQALVGSKTPKARFGSAISSLKVKKDVYLVVGAPFEPVSEDGRYSQTGAVYLYLYDKSKGKFGTYSQRITASRIDSALNGFGSSLSIPVDIDSNQTPDLAIGAFKSGHAVILRMRPKILLKGWIKFTIDTDTEEVTKIIRGTKQFNVKSCYRVETTLGIVSSKVDIWAKVVLHDTIIKFPHNVNERSGNTASETIYHKKVDTYKSETCTSIPVVAVREEGLGTDDSIEIDYPLRFSQEVWYNDTLVDTVSAYNIYTGTPEKQQQSKQNFNFKSFNDKVPSPQRTTASEEVPVTDCRDDVCRPNLRMEWSFYRPESKDKENIKSYYLGSSSEIVMQLVIINDGETAERSSIQFLWNSTVDITESISRNRWLHKTCTNMSTDTKMSFAHCKLRPKIRTGQNETIIIYLNTEEIAIREPKDFVFTVLAQVTFSDPRVQVARSSTELQMKTQSTTKATITGSKENELLRGSVSYYTTEIMKTSPDTNDSINAVPVPRSVVLYTPIRQRFTVAVMGTSVKEVIANFKIPVFWRDSQSQSTSNPLFLISYHDNSNNVKCSSTSMSTNLYTIRPIGSEPTSTEVKENEVTEKLSRRRRSVDAVNQTEETQENTTTTGVEISQDNFLPSSPTKQKQTPPDDALMMNCVSESDCLEVRCVIRKAKVNVPIYIQFDTYPIKTRIDNLLTSTKKSSLFIQAKGSVNIFPKFTDRHYQQSDEAVTVLAKISARVETWVYIAAIAGSTIGGILLLALIIFGLYKCGFFKREKRQELNQMKAEHNRKSMMIAAARASMMIQSTSGIDSRENLTEAEYRNEDTLMPSVQFKTEELPMELKD